MSFLLLLLGPAFIAATFVLMVQGVEPFANFFYICAWYGLIFTFDRLIHRRQGRSLIASCGSGFFPLLFWSAVSWYFFELLNFRLQNWYYVFVIDPQVLRTLSTFVSFATVFPGIFWIDHYLALRGTCGRGQGRPLHFSSRGLYLLQVAGLLFLALPMLWPTYFFPLVWGGVFLLLAPLNYRCGINGLLRQFERGEYGPTLRLLLAGGLAGLLWEFFNFWARAKWIYTVPYFDELKLFEMPLAGFIGFPPFAVECAVIYRFLVWHRLAPAFGSYTDQRPTAGVRMSRAALFLIAALCALLIDKGIDRFTLMSVTPRLDRVEELDPSLVAHMQERGLHYLTDLEGWDAEQHWMELEKSFGAKASADLRRITRLYLHQGIGTEFGNMLVRANIKSLEQLAKMNAADVAERLRTAAAGQRLPTLPQIRVWTRRAAAMERNWASEAAINSSHTHPSSLRQSRISQYVSINAGSDIVRTSHPSARLISTSISTSGNSPSQRPSHSTSSIPSTSSPLNAKRQGSASPVSSSTTKISTRITTYPYFSRKRRAASTIKPNLV